MGYFPRPHLVKIDVEGAGGWVLSGGGQLLREVRPTVLCEVWSENSDFVANAFAEAGYVILDGSLAPNQRSPLKRAVWGTLAVPEERWADDLKFMVSA